MKRTIKRYVVTDTTNYWVSDHDEDIIKGYITSNIDKATLMSQTRAEKVLEVLSNNKFATSLNPSKLEVAAIEVTFQINSK